MPAAPPSRLFLVGFMGVGKSQIGRALAGRIGWTFVDLDQEITRTAGRSIEALFAEEGEPAFRARETAALHRLATRERVVVATGGGCFVDAANRDWMQAHGLAIWLDLPLDALLARKDLARGRPLFQDREQVTALYQARRPAYARADAYVDTTDLSTEAVTAALATALRKLGVP